MYTPNLRDFEGTTTTTTNNNIPFICHIAELTELKGYKLQLKLLLL